MTIINRAIHHPIYVDSGMGAVGVEVDHALHVEQLMMQVLLTAQGERVCRPDFGCGLRRMVFGPNSSLGASLAQISVSQAMTRWLGALIFVDDVKVVAHESALEVTIAYTLRSTAERRYLNVDVAL